MTSATPPPPAPPLEPPAWQPPPPPPGPPERPQLRRSRSDKVIGGVGGGLAEYSGIDALLWRVGFVALALAGGTGVLVYLLLWLLMPASTTDEPGSRRPRPPAGPRSPVPGVTIAGLFIVVGTLALAVRFSDWDVDATGFLGGALIVVGLGLVAAAFTRGRSGRAGLIALGAVLSVALVTAETVPWDDIDGGIGDRSYAPASAAEVRPSYEGGVGNMTVDLSGVDVSDLDAPIRTRVDHGMGDVEIVLPRDADVRVSVDSGIGDVRLFGRKGLTEGTFDGTGTGSWVGDGEPEIILDVDAGVGTVEVTRD
ncbi:PspC domain-containing protein [Blastococcus sp. CCUG 61487]|uniref:PspC domain-containing protein n=1 Tax=Blastococcus sp. CCUG 61487 TaxID=1840703 RepID=UPI0010BFCFF1|nr:PspC domain-containing protein [Blastococcus sp. CCUG 61487]TKJ24519.1 hypothetical protein A6V29_04760 [Blastococcus sp. CCUG 61487]